MVDLGRVRRLAHARCHLLLFGVPNYAVWSSAGTRAPGGREIRSPDQTLKSLFDKRDRYRKWQIPHYWIIDPLENACYECDMTLAMASAVPILSKDVLRAAEIELPIANILSK